MAEKVVIYTRVSTEEQAKVGTSLAGQKAACLEYCERQGYSVAKVFVEEGESAKTANRTELKAMLEYCRTAKDIKAVVVHKLDRFSRNAADHSQMKVYLGRNGNTASLRHRANLTTVPLANLSNWFFQELQS